MFRVKYHYPGDPITPVTLMFGGEFAAANPNREIVISSAPVEGWFGRLPLSGTEEHFPVDDIICDSCNASISLIEPCAETDRRLYCWACFGEWIKPHLVGEDGVVVMKVGAK